MLRNSLVPPHHYNRHSSPFATRLASHQLRQADPAPSVRALSEGTTLLSPPAPSAARLVVGSYNVAAAPNRRHYHCRH